MRCFLLLALSLSLSCLMADVSPNPHPDPDRPRIYTSNFAWRAESELAGKLMKNNNYDKLPEVEKLTGCLSSVKYLIVPPIATTEVKLDLSCFDGIQRDEFIVVAKGNLDITAFPRLPPTTAKYSFGGFCSVEKRILPGKEPFAVRVSGQIPDPYFSFFNGSSQELLTFPVQEKVTMLRVSFHPDNAAFDWRVMERFPNVTSLELEGADRFLHSGGFKGNLRSLKLRGCHNLDLPPLMLSGLTLEVTDFRSEQLESLNPKELFEIEINESDLADISFLKRFTACRRLTLRYCPNLSEISSLTELKQLATLTLENTAVRDISPLDKLKKISRISIQDNQIDDFSPLAKWKLQHFSFSGSNPAADSFWGEMFAGQEFTGYRIVYPQKIEWNGHQWQLQFSGKRIGNTFLPGNGSLAREDYRHPSRFQLDHRSGQRDFPPAGQTHFVYIPLKSGKVYSITIKEGQRFSDFIRIDQNGATLTCAEGELFGQF